MPPTSRPHRRRVLTGTAAALVASLALASPAAADTSAATATAVEVLGGGSGTATASHDGTTATTTGSATPALSVLGGQGGVKAGVLVQSAVARADGTSAACAGLVGTGGRVTVGADGACAVSKGGGGVVVTLAGLTEVRADALVASCTADADGGTRSRVQLLNARVTTSGGLVTALALAADPAPGSAVVVPGVATLALGAASAPAGRGSTRVEALGITLLGATATVRIGAVTCGPNARTVPTPALPGPALALAAAGLLAVGLRLRRPLAAALTGLPRG